jgi:hypothetical protein
MMSFLEKFHNKLVYLLFPIIKPLSIIVSLALIVVAWSVGETYKQISVVIPCLGFIFSDISSAGVMERDYLPIQPGSGPFYHIYRFISRVSFLFLLITLVIVLIPDPLWIKYIFLGVFVIAIILRAIGDKKYRPKKPEE